MDNLPLRKTLCDKCGASKKHFIFVVSTGKNLCTDCYSRKKSKSTTNQPSLF